MRSRDVCYVRRLVLAAAQGITTKTSQRSCARARFPTSRTSGIRSRHTFMLEGETDLENVAKSDKRL